MLLERIQKLFAGANRRIIIISAYIGEKSLEILMNAVPKHVEKTIYVRWRLQDICSRASDPGIYDIAKKHNAQLLCHKDLHAKAYIADDKAFVGSANATNPGLGIAPVNNIELLTETDVSASCIQELLEILETDAKVALQVPDDFLAEIEYLKSEIDFVVEDDKVWIPNTFYEDIVQMDQVVKLEKSALRDYLALRLSIKASEEEIKQAANGSVIFSILNKHLLNTTVGLGIDGLAQLLVQETGDEKYKDKKYCLSLLSWIHNCADDMYVLDYDTPEPVLTPWIKRDFV